VLVGAGLSREARLSSADVPPPPLWSDLSRSMRADLYPGDPDAAPWDPLRLAEEYRSYFGQAAMDAFIRRHIRDAAWKPSERHSELVELPWADILTTNYDTLLERAARQSDRSYDPVRSESDIASAKAPRIIKLHGSIDTSDHFIVAEEDFRTYPARYAAFVNLARQCFVENELCLLGFSGDDPNFLAWAGWVRDHLGSSARRIYLAGALDLSPAKRRYLEARNIAPIDVHPMVKEIEPAERHAAANQLILNALHALAPTAPHDWEPARDGRVAPERDEAAQLAALARSVAGWAREREHYPGWLVCPVSRRTALRHATELPPAVLLEKVDAALSARTIYEWCWRHRTALWPIHPTQIPQIRRFADPAAAVAMPMDERLLIASVLLEHGRRESDPELFTEMAAFIESNALSGSNALADLRYQQALAALEDLEFEKAEALSGEIVGEDPSWMSRRASILAATGQFGQAAGLVDAAVGDLRERERRDRSSVWVRSRLAWALFVQRMHRRSFGPTEPWPQRFRESRCDPWQDVEGVLQDAASERRKKLEKPPGPLPSFEPGSFKLPSRTIHFGDTRVEPSDTFALLLERGGIPPRLDMVTFYMGERLDALELGYEPTLHWYLALLRTGLGKGDVQLQRYFARVAIAALDESVVTGLVDRVKRGKDYWAGLLASSEQSTRIFARDRLLTLLELLARLTVRLDSVGAAALHLETLALADQLGGRLRFEEGVGKLLANTFAAVQPGDREALVLADLEMPLVGEDRAAEPSDWIFGTALRSARRNSRLRGIVNKLLEAAARSGGERSAAISRLTALDTMGALTEAERRRFARAAWSRLDGIDPPLPADSQILPHFWAHLPVEGRDVPAILRQRLFAVDGEIEPSAMGQMIRAVRAGTTTPEPAQARERFDTIAARRFKAVDPTDFISSFEAGMRGYDPTRAASFAGAALTCAIAPYLAHADRTDERLSAIWQFCAENDTYAASGAMVPFLPRQAAAAAQLGALIRRGLMMQDAPQVSHACDALQLWIEAHPVGTHAAPPQLAEQLLAIIELRQSPGLWRLLACAVWLLHKGVLPSSEYGRIATALGDLLTETDYPRVDPMSAQGGVVSLVREQAVRLAMILERRGFSDAATAGWIAAAPRDPLPEVRYASLASLGEYA
jgi:hypothetical protein